MDNYRQHPNGNVRRAYQDGRVARLTGIPLHRCPHLGRVISSATAEKIREGKRPSRSTPLTKDLLRWAWRQGWRDKDAEL